MITATTDQLERAQRFLGAIPGAAERAMAKALNSAIKAAREEALEAITARYAIDVAEVKTRLSTMLAKPGALASKLKLRSSSLALHYFPHTPDAPGTGGPGKGTLSVEVKRGGARSVPGAFVAQLGVKPRIVRRTGGKTASGKDALQVLYTVPTAEMLGVPAVHLAVEARAVEVLDEKLTIEIDRELGAAT